MFKALGLILSVFLSSRLYEPNGAPYVADHIHGICHMNTLSNGRWLTSSQNMEKDNKNNGVFKYYSIKNITKKDPEMREKCQYKMHPTLPIGINECGAMCYDYEAERPCLMKKVIQYICRFVTINVRVRKMGVKDIPIYRFNYECHHKLSLESSDIIDHNDTNMLNNCIKNLRKTDASGNSKNRKSIFL